MKKASIAPSLLAADFGNLQRDVEMVNASEATYHHIDVMDGRIRQTWSTYSNRSL